MIAPFALAFQPTQTGFAYLAVARGKRAGQWYQASIPPGHVMISGQWSSRKRARLRFSRGSGMPLETVLDIPAGTGPRRIAPLTLTALDEGAVLAVDAYSLDQEDIDNAIMSLSVITLPFST